MGTDQTERSSSVTIEELFRLVPIENINDVDLKNFSFDLTDITNSRQANEHLRAIQTACSSYAEAIINENIFSFFLSNADQAYLIIINKHSANDQSFIRYSFSRLLEDYQLGQLQFSTANSFYRIDQTIDLSFVQLFANEGYIFALSDLSSNYIDSLHWWKKGLFYQIIPSSYQDSNQDGFGDLPGLQRRLDHIQQLGAKTIWLTPIYTTPFRDLGYDISDFCAIDPRFGTLEDFKSLVDDIHRRQMRIVLDFVPNHCAKEHPWFAAALRNEQPYIDYFVWHPGKNNDSSTPPTNWVGYAGQSMWTWAPERKQWYLHQFMDGQPDFNFRNENVCREMEKIMAFWLDQGVDGFRADAIRHLVENDEFKDEPLKDNAEKMDLEVDYDAFEHTETGDRPENIDILIRWRHFLDEYTTKHQRDYIVLITETQNKDVEKDMAYYGTNRWSRGNDMAINFFLAYFLGEDPEKRTGEKLSELIQDWLSNLPPEAWSTWTVVSHDSKRVATKLASPKLVDGFYMLLFLLPGTPILYYGEELGMENLQFTKELRDQINDLSAFNYGKNDESKIEKMVRDGQRTPMQWSSNENYAGFTNASKPYHPLSLSWKTINVENQLAAPRSHLKLVQQLVQLRQGEPFYAGQFKEIHVEKHFYSFMRYSKKHKDTPIYAILINMFGAGQEDKEDQCITTDLIKLLKCTNKHAKGRVIARSCVIKENSALTDEGNEVDLNRICLYASEAVVLQLLVTMDDIHLPLS